LKKFTYNKYSEYLNNTFGERVQKIPLNAGFTCPNRDGSKGVGGCTYCNNVSFNPFYSIDNNDLAKQIESGIKFYSKRYGVNKFLAYFQAYTNTYSDLDSLKMMYESILDYPGICGIVLGTRPDCVSDDLLGYLKELSESFYLSIEYGIETTHEKILLNINRCHTYEESVKAIEATAENGIHVGAHLILGLPGETESMMIETARRISNLPLNSIKLHQLQIIEQTVMAKQYNENPKIFHQLTYNDYIELVVRFLENLNPDFVIERLNSESPPELIIHPNWSGKRTSELAIAVENRMKELNTYQGKALK
jgi:radical SAM protein (TIGR01212 family)